MTLVADSDDDDDDDDSDRLSANYTDNYNQQSNYLEDRQWTMFAAQLPTIAFFFFFAAPFPRHLNTESFCEDSGVPRGQKESTTYGFKTKKRQSGRNVQREKVRVVKQRIKFSSLQRLITPSDPPFIRLRRLLNTS